MDQAIVFTATKRGADDLADRLNGQGFTAAALHGDMNQRQRTRTLGMLQKGQLRILVATDVASRGIDVQGISHAVNYDLPMQAEDYVHRIGRTGRAGRSGLAFTLATHAERHKVRRIEHFIGQPIPSETIEGLEPKKTARPTYTDRKPGGGGKSFAPRGNGGGYAGNKPAYAGRKPGADRAPYGDKPAFGDRPARTGDRPAFGDRPSYDRGADSRKSFGGGEERGGYKGRSERPTSDARPARADRPAFSDRPAGDRPAFSDRPARSARPDFAHKSAAGKPAARPGFAGKPTSTRGKSAARRTDFGV